MSIILAIVTVVIAIVSCSKNVTLARNNGDTINFRPLTAMQSKAVEKNVFTNGDKIDVHAQFDGEKYFQDNFIFSSTGFDSAKPYFWPEGMGAENPVIFNVFHNAEQGAETPGELLAFSPQSAAADQKDVLFSKLSVSSVSDATLSSGVELRFRHALSEVLVAVKNSNSNLSYDIKGVKISYLSKQGDFKTSEVVATSGDGHLPTGCWGNLSTADASKSYEQTLAADGSFDATETTALGVPWMLIPQKQTGKETPQYTSAEAGSLLDSPYVAVKMVIKNATDGTVVKGGTEGIWCCWLADFNFIPGYRYTFIIDLAEGGYHETNQNDNAGLDSVLKEQAIRFSVNCTIDSWE